ncbi:MAG: hypothetical protein ACKO8O_09580 [Betaproteobacteria bacterium]
MLLVGTREFAQSARKQGQLFNGTQYWRNDFFRSSDDEVCTPQCYLVEQFPDTVNPTHFHVQNQFQLFTRGAGTIGRNPKALGAYTVHYAGAYTGYGPIVAGPEGVDYITMRAFRDPGAKFVPQQRAALRPGPKRHWASEALQPWSLEALAALEAPVHHAVHGPDADGLAVDQIRLPAHAVTDIPIAPAAVAMFVIVIQGNVDRDGRRLGHLENLFVSAHHAPCRISTSDSPAEVLVLHMPAHDPAYA